MQTSKNSKVETRSKRSSRSDINMFIVLENTNGVYRAGDHVRGHVVISLTEDTKVKDVMVSLVGFSRVRWDEERTYTKGSAPRVSRKHTETHIDKAVSLIKRDDGIVRQRSEKNAADDASLQNSISPPLSDYKRQTSSTSSRSSSKQLHSSTLERTKEEGGLICLPRGDSRMLFDLALDVTLPSTFVGRHGFVKYALNAVMCRSRAADVECRRDVTVVAVYDLNTDPNLALPAIEVKDLSKTCCFSGGKQVSANLRLLHRACVPGDTMPFRAEIVNGSTRCLYDIRLSLVQDTVFRASGRCKKTRKTLVVMPCNKRSIDAGVTYAWEGQNIMLPSDIVPTTKDTGHSISVKYSVTLSMRYSMWTRPFVVTVTLVVGTQALRPGAMRAAVKARSQKVGDEEKSLMTSLKLSSSVPSLPSVEAEQKKGRTDGKGSTDIGILTTRR